jgi:hypothetical protein
MHLPKVRMDLVPLSFISRTASTGSWATNRVFTHDSGSVKVVEKTTFDSPARASVPDALSRRLRRSDFLSDLISAGHVGSSLGRYGRDWWKRKQPSGRTPP